MNGGDQMVPSSFSFCSFLYSGVLLKGLKLSVSDVIEGQKGSNGDGKLQFFGWGYDFTRSLCAKIHLWARILRELIL